MVKGFKVDININLQTRPYDNINFKYINIFFTKTIVPYKG